MSPARDETVDIAKGIAISTVVLAHVMMGLATSGIMSEEFIRFTMRFYVWYMPLFFFASGLYLERSLSRSKFSNFTAQKAMSLGWPFIVWSLLFGALQFFFARYTNTGSIRIVDVLKGILPWEAREHMWFLPALLVVFILAALCRQLARAAWLTAFTLLSIASFALSIVFVSENQLLQYAIWAALGAWTSRTGWIPRYEATAGLLKMFVVPLFAVLIFALTAFILLPSARSFYQDALPFLITTFLGIVAVLALAASLRRTAILGQLLQIAGVASLHIYLTHVPVLAAIRILITQITDVQNALVMVLISVVACLLVGIAAQVASRRLRLVSALFEPPWRFPTMTGPSVKGK